MSDDGFSFADIANIIKRISELEKYTKGFAETLDKRIMELEKNSVNKEGLEKIIENIYDKFAELREKVETCQCDVMEYDTKLNELKEDHKKLKKTFAKVILTTSEQRLDLDARLLIQHEVLREFGKTLQEMLWLWEKNDFTSMQITPLRLKIRDLLEKLEGVGSARQTECKWETTEYCMKPEEDSEKEINDLTDNSWKEIFEEKELTLDKSSYGKGYMDGMKDSGGEKEFSLKELNKFADEQIAKQESHYIHKTDSKPAEPYFSMTTGEQQIAYEEAMGERVRDATRIVKREDLHDIKKFLGYIHDSRGIDVSNFKERAYELWKRIKEEYKIE